MKINSMNGVLLKRRTCGREDAIGILLLLHLAHRAVRKYFVDGSCESILFFVRRANEDDLRGSRDRL